MVTNFVEAGPHILHAGWNLSQIDAVEGGHQHHGRTLGLALPGLRLKFTRSELGE